MNAPELINIEDKLELISLSQVSAMSTIPDGWKEIEYGWEGKS